jgi:hypothetical protein
MTERLLCSGTGLAYDLMAAAGRAAAGLVASSRARFLAHPRCGTR